MYQINKSLSIAKKILPKIYDTSVNRNWHFCFLFRKNKLLTIGRNDMSVESAKVLKFVKRFRLEQEYHFMHAEMDAVSRLWGKVRIDKNIKFVVLRINKFMQIQKSKPCRYCKEIISALGVEDVYWSNVDGFWKTENGKDIKIA